MYILQPSYEIIFANAKAWLYQPTKPLTTLPLNNLLGTLHSLQSDFTYLISFESHNMVESGVQGNYSYTQLKNEEPKTPGHNQD